MLPISSPVKKFLSYSVMTRHVLAADFFSPAGEVYISVGLTHLCAAIKNIQAL
jgi:hypothetical protein